jgi:demethylmenaquinone methyltransferase / 2-methoxy-6-polyprenyl-1,4-benzoquinol methylase
MFAAIARSYDLNNNLHSLGLARRWRRFAVRAAQVRPGEAVLDCACGTGDLTHAFAGSPAGSVVGLDFTPEMLDLAERKRHRIPAEHAAKVRYVEGDAQRLPFADGSFDVVSIAFGIRNVADPNAALREFARVLRPGGRLVVLEFDQPRSPVVRWVNEVYCRRVMPLTATVISGDRTGAYRYLPSSVGSFLTREEMMRSIRGSGLEPFSATPLTWGVCVCYVGRR